MIEYGRVQTVAQTLLERELERFAREHPRSAELARRGHEINRWEAWNELAGHAHGITIDPVSGARVGGADPRSDGAAIGY